VLGSLVLHRDVQLGKEDVEVLLTEPLRGRMLNNAQFRECVVERPEELSLCNPPLADVGKTCFLSQRVLC